MRILLLDIESAPNLAHVWGLWQQNVGLSQLLESGYTLCWAAKWLGEKEVHVGTIRQGERQMVKAIHELMSEADAIVHYNGNRFDIPILNKDILLQGLPPPAPSKQIDLLRVVKQRFRFPSNKLAYVSERLGIGGKLEHSGHEMWVKCMAGMMLPGAQCSLTTWKMCGCWSASITSSSRGSKGIRTTGSTTLITRKSAPNAALTRISGAAWSIPPAAPISGSSAASAADGLEAPAM